MKRLVVVVILYVTLLATVCWGQSPGYGEPVTGVPVYNGQATGSSVLGAFTISTGVKAGIRNIGLNYSIDIVPTEVTAPFIVFPPWGSELDMYPVDVSFRDSTAAFGGLRIAVERSPGTGVFASFCASIPRSIRIESSQGPSFGGAIPERRDWDSCRLQWWQADVGASYGLAGVGAALMAGVKFDRVSLRISDPQPTPGYTVFGTSYFFPDYGGDLKCSVVIPYVGMQILGPYFNGSVLLGSAGAAFSMPLQLNHAGTYVGFPGFFARYGLSEELRYRLTSGGLFVEARMETAMALSGGLTANFWAEGSWMRVRGNGDADLDGGSRWVFFGFNGGPTRYSLSSAGTSTLTQYVISAGATAELAF
jgi:hypothetical protein